MARYRILSLDGGGIRGVVTAVLLQRIGAALGGDGWLGQAELLAGTSTGGLIALGLAGGVDLPTLRSLYEDQGAEIFDDSWLDDLVDLGKIAGAEYGSENLEKLLKSTLGADTTLGDLNRRVLITSFDLDNEDAAPAKRRWKPKIFHNFPGSDSDADELAYKVGMYTCAAPTYFPTYEGYVDGGVFANNPAMCALAQAQSSRWSARPKLSEIVLLSIGTGTSLVYVKGKTLDWGHAQWAEPIMGLILDGVSDIARYQCEQLLGPKFHRVAPFFGPEESFPLDCVEKIPDLVRFAEALDLGTTVAWLRRTWL